MTHLRFDDGPDARTIHACVIPYREVTTCHDGAGPNGKGPYLEEFLPTAFSEQIKEAETRPLRVWLHFEHQRENRNVIGHAVELSETLGGLYCSLRVHHCTWGDWMLAAIRKGQFTGVSMQGTSLQSRVVDGVTQRTKARLSGVALCAQGAYAGARVFGIRKAWSGELPDPTSEDEFNLRDLERVDGTMRALAMRCIDQAPHSYRNNSMYKYFTRRCEEIAEQRAELERRLNHQPDPAALHAAPPRPKVLHRDCATTLAVR